MGSSTNRDSARPDVLNGLNIGVPARRNTEVRTKLLHFLSYPESWDVPTAVVAGICGVSNQTVMNYKNKMKRPTSRPADAPPPVKHRPGSMCGVHAKALAGMSQEDFDWTICESIRLRERQKG